jgi:hypothetical protein
MFGLLAGAACGALTQLIWKLLVGMAQKARRLDADFPPNTDLSHQRLQALTQRLDGLHQELWSSCRYANQSHFDAAGGKAVLMMLFLFNAVTMMSVFVIFSSSHARFFAAHPGGVQVLVLGLLGAGLLAYTVFRVSDVHEAYFAIVKRLEDFADEPTICSPLCADNAIGADEHKAAAKRFTNKWKTRHMGLECCQIAVNRRMFHSAVLSLALQIMVVFARQVIAPAVGKVHE